MKEKLESIWETTVTFVCFIPKFWKWFFQQIKDGALFK